MHGDGLITNLAVSSRRNSLSHRIVTSCQSDRECSLAIGIGRGCIVMVIDSDLELGALELLVFVALSNLDDLDAAVVHGCRV